jgi:hypothetical protein
MGKSREYSGSNRYKQGLLQSNPSRSATNRKDGQMGLHKSKKLCTTKDMVSKLKRLPTEWEKTFVSYTSDKRLITRIYRELKNYSPKINEPIKKWQLN